MNDNIFLAYCYVFYFTQANYKQNVIYTTITLVYTVTYLQKYLFETIQENILT